jgi:phosphocarrier protein FPr
LFRPAPPTIPTHPTYDPRADWDAIMAAIDKTRAQIRAMRDAVAQRSSAYTASLFDAHLLILEDSSLLQPVCDAIFDDKLNAAAAWARATEKVADAYRALDDEYLSARAADVIDVQRQVLLNLLGEAMRTPVMHSRGILVAPDLTPADTARLDPTSVLGVCTAFGGPTSHSAILARSFGIPAVVGLGEAILDLHEDTQLIVDGAGGQVWIEPDADRLADYTQRIEGERMAREAARVAAAAPAVTRDGRRIEVAANIGSPRDASVAAREGAESVGLFRTEFLFLDRRDAPDEEEQYAVYRATAEALERRPLIVRTLDAGGDKPLPYLNLEHESNPFLGWRAIRLCLAQPEFFKTQLRAIVRVAAEFPAKVMFPMIATLDEWRAARSLLWEAGREVRARGLSAPDHIETGIMVEIPAAALRAEQFAAEVDFFSIGTNDLTQYTLAAERGNARVAALADALHPAVLQLIHNVVQAAHAQGKWVGVCGELAGDARATALLVGLGVDELSMSAPAIPSIKQIVRALDADAARRLAQAALARESAAEVRQMLNATG